VRRGPLFRRGDQDCGIEIHTAQASAPFLTLLAAGLIDQDPPHGFGRGGKKMTATVPALGFVGVHELFAKRDQ
jgi:hypothetical protein